MFTDEAESQREMSLDNGAVQNFRVRHSHDPLDGAEKEGPLAAVPSDDLDSRQNTELFSKLVSYFRHEKDRQEINREQMRLDEAFYDSKQWSSEDQEILLERGQEPLVFNMIAPTVNWLLGTERNTRSDYKVLGRRKDGALDAERKSELLKYLSDVNGSAWAMSRAFEDQVKAGLGWIECGVREDDDGEPIYDRAESWRNMLHDSAAHELDLNDARYIFRQRWTDFDVAATFYPKRVGVLEQSLTTYSDFYQNLDSLGDPAMDTAEEEMANTEFRVTDGMAWRRERVRLIEGWFRIPVKDHYMKGGEFSGEIFDPRSNGHIADFSRGVASIIPKTKMRMHVGIFCEAGMLFLARSPYRHNRFPFTPLWCFRDSENNLPYGVIRNMRDVQRDLNKRASKALHHLSTNKAVVDEGAIPDLEMFRDEVARPDAVIVKTPGLSVDLNADRNLADAHLDLMNRDVQMIQTLSGITDENLGRQTNAVSGRAIQARQDQGTLTTAAIFDNLRRARMSHGGKRISLIEQYMREEKQFRITNKRGNPSYHQVNDGLPENDITKHKADFIISEAAWSASMKQAQAESLLDMFGQLASAEPQVFVATLDLILEMMDIPHRDEIVRRVRSINGQEDPDADPDNPDPETLARREKEAQMEALNVRGIVADILKKEGDAARASASAEQLKEMAKKVLADTVGANVESQTKAVETALLLLQQAGVAPAADKVLSSAGFVPQTDGGGP